MKISSSPLCLALLLALLAGCAAPASAQTVVSFFDVTRLDKNASNPWAVNGTSNESLLVGNASTSNGIFETAILIDISSFDTEIAAAGSITFNVAYDAVLGSGREISAFFFSTNSTSISGIGGQTFHDTALAGDNGGTILAGDFSAPGVATYNVTSIVKSLSLSGLDNIGILLTSGLTSDPSSTAHDIRFYAEDTLGSQANGGAYLSLNAVPEPATSATLLGGMGLVVLRRLRRG